MVAHAFNPLRWVSVRLRPAWATERQAPKLQRNPVLKEKNPAHSGEMGVLLYVFNPSTQKTETTLV